MDQTAARPRTATYARGEDTRRRLIEAAIEAFGTYGYDAASTRRLAEQAGTTLPSIQYYFGGKEGLYRAAVEHIAQSMNERMAPVAERVYAALAAPKLRHSDLLGLLGEMLDAFVALMVGTENPDSRKRFLTRAELEGSVVLDTFRDSIKRHVVQPAAALISRLLDQPPKDETVMLRTIAIVGQVSVFCHFGARRALGWEKFTDERVRAVQGVVRQHAEAILDAAVRKKK
jgi:AcrR family transcriptional regulator